MHFEKFLENVKVNSVLNDYRRRLVEIAISIEANNVVALFENLSDASLIHHFIERSGLLENAKIGDSEIKSKYYISSVTNGLALSRLTPEHVAGELQMELNESLLTSKNKYYENLNYLTLDLHSQEGFMNIYERLNDRGMRQLINTFMDIKTENCGILYRLYEKNFTQLHEHYYDENSLVPNFNADEYNVLFMILYEYFESLEAYERIGEANDYRIDFSTFINRYNVFKKDTVSTTDFYLECYRIGGPRLLFEIFEKFNEEGASGEGEFWDNWQLENNARPFNIHHFDKDKFFKLYDASLPVGWNIELHYNECLVKN